MHPAWTFFRWDVFYKNGVMKYFCMLFFLILLSGGQETKKESLITSQVDCIVPVYSVVPEGGFKNEDSVTVAEIVQMK
ncbi:MAG: hypothetical protein DI539_12120 [Flavobacterium psychrophilum]|nr:MAG: hypothetical protein DI539_12120 [Flavobacterium psychrophilum]